VALAACSSPPRPAPEQVGAVDDASAAKPDKPRLVVAIVFDQLPSWALTKYLPHLAEDGALRSGIARGSYLERVVFGYASTTTAPGHASIFSGAPPSVSGITGNSLLDLESGKARPFVSDEKHPVLGYPTASASPLVLRVDTVGDVLKRETSDRAQVVSLSIKDRAAVLSGGREADVALWFDHRIPGFTTSTYYAQRLPAWLERWQSAHPIDALLVPWEPNDPALLARVIGADDAPGEGGWLGLGRRFPHRVADLQEPYSALRTTPQLSEHLLALAREAVTSLDLGGDEVVDLLAVSISGTDYTGHVWGPDSWEYLDHLWRADRALGAFLRWLEERTPIAVLVTSDHGVVSLVERSGKGGRLHPEELAARAKSAVEKVAGKPAEGGWIRGFVRPFVYLAPGMEGEQRGRVVRAIEEELGATEGVHLAIDVARTRGWAESADPFERSVGLSIAAGSPGDIYVVPASGWVFDEELPRGAGTNHGTPWPFDTEVPVVLWGTGVAEHRESGPFGQERVAASLAALLGVPAPARLRAAPLPGIRE
jgi:hypothetical protein